MGLGVVEFLFVVDALTGNDVSFAYHFLFYYWRCCPDGQLHADNHNFPIGEKTSIESTYLLGGVCDVGLRGGIGRCRVPFRC